MFQMNKKGDAQSIILLIVSLFIIGIIIFFFNHIDDQLFSALSKNLEANPNFNNTEATRALSDIHEADNSVWDYAFLAIVFGYFLALMLSSFSTRISAVFYWIYGLIAIIGLILAVGLSNIWQTAAEKPEFAETILRFPIMDTILGSYYPIFITIIVVISMILLFGKPAGSDLQ